jgi:hypothetical protein
MRTKLLLLILAVAAVAAAIGYRLLNAKPAAASDGSAEISVKAAALYAEFVENEAIAGKRYNDKLVEVEGIVRDVDPGTDGTMDVLLETGDPLGAVVCEFPANETVKASKGATVRIKGFCAGYNLDVLLQRCCIADR